jgi:2-keto-4-pentenoate hydratase
MTSEGTQQAAQLLWRTWQLGEQLDALPAPIRPASRHDGYAVQAAVQTASGQALYGWKIAATSAAGQKHIGVDGPLAGRLLRNRVFNSGASVSLVGNAMRVMEAEFAFKMRDDLPVRGTPYSMPEVMAAVAALHVAIEIPDSRYRDFPSAGAAQLIADNACASWFVLGPEVRQDWRSADLPNFPVSAECNGVRVREGKGSNVLGDPRIALTWIANELIQYGTLLRANEVITTGTCIAPAEIAPGDHVVANFGEFGCVEAHLTA